MGNACAHPNENVQQRSFLEWRAGLEGPFLGPLNEGSPERTGISRAEGPFPSIKLVEVSPSELPPTCVVAKVRGYRCTKCKALVPSAREALEHCGQTPELTPERLPEELAAAAASSPLVPRAKRRSHSRAGPTKLSPRPAGKAPRKLSPGPSIAEHPATPTRSAPPSSGYVCSCCRAVLPTAREAVDHCRRDRGPEPIAPTREAEPVLPAVEDEASRPEADLREPSRGPEPERLPGNPLAVDADGRPTVTWYTCPETGASATLVQELDGSQHAFNENTVASLITATEDVVVAFLRGLSDRMLHGLVHEVGRRLVEGSQCYQQLKSEFEASKAGKDYAFFGLSEDATEAELDNAYRQMARKMHPDKNGGTHEAKEAFQEMKELYEALKERRRSGKDRPRPQQPESKAPPSEDSARITYDPTDRESMGSATSRMLTELRTLHQHFTTLRAGLQGYQRPAGHQGGS